MREIQELRGSLAELQASQQVSSEQLQQFLYAASHDLQEPLRGIITYAQLLDRHAAADPVAHEYTTFVLGGAFKMRELLQHLLIYSRAGSSKQRRLLNLDVPLQMALLKLAPEIKACGAQIIRHPMPEAIANEVEIAQVFENILSNSLKFHSTAPLQIVVAAEEGNSECLVTISDNGLGVDPRHCDQIFMPFKRLHGNLFPGSGLGLAIADKILRAHQGRIKLESDGQHGTTVSFTLPV